MDLFRGRKLLIATKHQKDRVIAAPMSEAFGVNCFTSGDEFDTDQLGTFTGEKPRVSDPVSTAREKCLKGMEQFNCDLGIASEGSFFPDPYSFIGHVNEEVLILIDKKHDFEVIVKELSFETNFYAGQVDSEEALLELASKLNFPSHGLILRSEKDNDSKLFKGIKHQDHLLETYRDLKQNFDQVMLETDMRAMHNPTRMAVIAEATLKLIDKVKSTCKVCGTPGFGITGVEHGLPCGWCGTPTQSVLSYVHQCTKCNYTAVEKYPKGKETEDPMYCDSCNP